MGFKGAVSSSFANMQSAQQIDYYVKIYQFKLLAIFIPFYFTFYASTCAQNKFIIWVSS